MELLESTPRKRRTSATATICILTFFLLMLAQGINTTPKKALLQNPSLETFASSKQMQRYFDQRNLRSLRLLKYPAISAINEYDEAEPFDLHPVNKRIKRAAAERKLPNQPRMLKFGVDDAVEPSDEVKKLIHRHRNKNRESKQQQQTEPKHKEIVAPITPRPITNTKKPTISTATPLISAPTTASLSGSASTSTTTDNFKNIMKISPRGRNRNRRSVFQQPANFKVQMIPFDISDAREPDHETSLLIKRGRALDFERSPAVATLPNNEDAMQQVNEPPEASKPKIVRRVKQKRKRTRREAPKTPPQMIKFELEDAREPDANMKSLIQQQQTRSGKDLKETSSTTATNSTTDGSATDSEQDQDLSTHESKRHYVYAKDHSHITKKSINSLPHQVQKVITHLIKDPHHIHPKAYVKYMPVQQAEYAYLKTVPYGSKLIQAPHYGVKSHVKYQKPEQIHAPPAPEKLRYSYAPAPAAIKSAYTLHSHAQAQQAISQPIVVAEPVPHAQTSYSTQAVHPSPATMQHQSIAQPHFRPSKPDPLFEDNKIASSGGHYEKAIPLEHYKYELISNTPQHHQPQQQHEAYEYEPSKPKVLSHHHQLLTEAAATAAPLIKIEYHAPQQTYKDLQEFKELSSLIGKSPDDQVHGLTYLLAKDMQNKIHAQRQQKNLENEVAIIHQQQEQKHYRSQQRPQDNTAPILFHPEEAQQQQQQQAQQQVLKHDALGVRHGRLIGMAKVKEYIPIVESNNSAADEEEAPAPTVVTVTEATAHAVEGDYELKLEPKAPTPHSYIELGLSPNYELPSHQQTKIEHVIHHPAAKQHVNLEVAPAHTYYGVVKSSSGGSGEHHLGAGLQEGESAKYGLHSEDSHALQYASKYAFGYRIRDFHTGNDFGHKQNRDLDGVTRGQYHILLPDGRIQNVIYHADDTGFHADVSFESGH